MLESILVPLLARAPIPQGRNAMRSQKSHGGIHFTQDHAQDGFGARLSPGCEPPKRQAAEQHSFRAQR